VGKDHQGNEEAQGNRQSVGIGKLDEEEGISAKKGELNMNSVAKFISLLLSSREQAHIFHLQTPSYAAHKALQGYYEDIVDLIDTYVESYQGRYGILKGYMPTNTILEDDSVVSYFMGLQKFVDETRGQLPQDGELNNTIDEISGLISSTVYKLKFLK
jgi:hypothetical protein